MFSNENTHRLSAGSVKGGHRAQNNITKEFSVDLCYSVEVLHHTCIVRELRRTQQQISIPLIGSGGLDVVSNAAKSVIT